MAERTGRPCYGPQQMSRKPDAPSDALDVSATQAPDAVEELPVVARLAIEIRSDGSRTVARGALQDIATGQDVRIEVSAGTLIELGLQLGAQLRTQLAATVRRSLFELPRAMFRRRRDPP